jgi:HlyD family secretion protein
MKKAILAIIIFLSACEKEKNTQYQGYAEGEFIVISAHAAGTLEKLYINKGDSVKKGDILFTIEDELNTAAFAGAKARRDAAAAELANAKTGARNEEIDVIRSRLAGAEAALNFSSAQYNRDKTQFKAGTLTQARLEQSKAAYEQNTAAVEALKKELNALSLPARPEQIKALEAQLSAAAAAVTQAEWNLSKNKTLSPAEGIITEVIRREGELMAVGSPALQMLPHNTVKARFFVPYEDLPLYKIDDVLRAQGEGESADCRVSYISPKPEYTPPVIYSYATNKKLVFMFECSPDGDFHPGAPLTVSPR